MIGDLHCHSYKSDGSLAPSAIVELAARLGLKTLALTDHDTMDGVAAAAARARELGVRLVPGLEVSTYDRKHEKKVHLLCYFPKRPAPLLALCRETLRRRTAATLEMAEKTATRYPVTPELISQYARNSTAVYKQHITLALMDMGYSLSVFGELYRSLFSSDGGWALVESEQPDPREVIRVIKETGGAAVLAHPGVYHNFDIIDELCGLGLDGIEVFHPRMSETDTRRCLEAAQKHRLIRTGGSDFHGMCASRITRLGDRGPEAEELARLVDRFG